MSKDLPAVLAFIPISADGWITLNKTVRKHLEFEELKKLFLEMHDEVVITSQGNNVKQIASTKGNRIQLPEKALKKLEVSANSLVALIERKDAVAIKRFVIEEREAEKARIVPLLNKCYVFLVGTFSFVVPLCYLLQTFYHALNILR